MGGCAAASARLQCAMLPAVVALILGVATAQQDSLGPAEAPSAFNTTNRALGSSTMEEEEDGGLPISIGLLVAFCIIGACLCCCCYAAFHACVFYYTYGWMYEWAKWGKEMVFGKKDEDKPGEGGEQTGWASAPWNSGGGNNNGPSAPWSNNGGGGGMSTAAGVVGNLVGGAAPWSRDVELPEGGAANASAPAGSTEAAKAAAEP